MIETALRAFPYKEEILEEAEILDIEIIEPVKIIETEMKKKTPKITEAKESPEEKSAVAPPPAVIEFEALMSGAAEWKPEDKIELQEEVTEEEKEEVVEAEAITEEVVEEIEAPAAMAAPSEPELEIELTEEEANTEIEFEMEETEPVTETETVSVAASVTESESEAEMVMEAAAESATETDTSTVSITEAEIEAIAAAIADSSLESDADTETDADTIAETDTDSDSDTDSSPEIPVVFSTDVGEAMSCVEALLFMADKPVSIDRLKEMLEQEFPADLIREAALMIQQRYQADHHGIELAEVGGGYLFRTKPIRAAMAKKLAKVQAQRLSTGSMETLAIVAYKQPVMKEEVDQVRGVDSSHFIRILLEKKLIKISGRSELPGRPMLYSTTQDFLQVFGLKDLSALPPLRELEQMIPGSQVGDEEDPVTREMKRVVSEMNADHSAYGDYDPKEDEAILTEIREKISQVTTTTPYLEEQKAVEKLQAEKTLDDETQARLDQLLGPPLN